MVSSCCNLVSVLINLIRWEIVCYGTLSCFFNLSWIIVHCCVIAVFILVESIGLEHALYTESKVTFRPSRPRRVTKDYRSNTWLSSSLWSFLDRTSVSVIITVPPGFVYIRPWKVCFWCCFWCSWSFFCYYISKLIFCPFFSGCWFRIALRY